MVSGCAYTTVAGVGVWATTGKAPADHALSAATDSDCISTRIVTDDKVCQTMFDKQEAAFDKRLQGVVR